MSKCTRTSNLWLFFFGILAVYSLLGLFFIVPSLLGYFYGHMLLAVVIVILVAIAVLFALAIILKGLSRLFHHSRR